MENLLEQCPSANGVWLSLATKKMPCLSVCPVGVVAPYSILLVPPDGIAKDLADHVSYILTHLFL
jgi:hypothetical protein